MDIFNINENRELRKNLDYYNKRIAKQLQFDEQLILDRFVFHLFDEKIKIDYIHV